MRRAILLGLLQGPTEMAPVSSSAHTALLSRDREQAFAKSLQVALHGGTACALALSMRGELLRTFARTSSGSDVPAGGSPATMRKLLTLALAVAPPRRDPDGGTRKRLSAGRRRRALMAGGAARARGRLRAEGSPTETGALGDRSAQSAGRRRGRLFHIDAGRGPDALAHGPLTGAVGSFLPLQDRARTRAPHLS